MSDGGRWRRFAERAEPWQVDAGAALALAALGLVAWFAELSPALARGDGAERTARAVDEARARARQLRASAGHRAAELAEAERAIATAGVTIEPAARLNARLGAVSDLAARCGAQVEAIEPAPAAPAGATGRLAAVPVRLTCRATYGQAARLLRELRARMPDVAVTGLELTGTPAAGDPMALVNLNLVWHAGPDNGAAAAEGGR